MGDWISNLINKSASENNDKAFAEATAKIEENAKKTPEENNKVQAFDIAKFAGIFAAFGMAIGYIGAFFTSLGKGFGDLAEKGWYMPILAIIGLMLVISGPAMIMAWIKLRKRNLTPLLNANGWAINADAVVSVMFGTTLTQQAQFPMLQLVDPLAKKGMSAWQKWLISVASVLVVLLGLWLANLLNWCKLPSPLPCFNKEVVEEVVTDTPTETPVAEEVAQ